MLARAVVSECSARGCTESHSVDFRSDYPKRDGNSWLKHTLAWRNDSGDVRFAYRSVGLVILSNDVQPVEPSVRVY